MQRLGIGLLALAIGVGCEHAPSSAQGESTGPADDRRCIAPPGMGSPAGMGAVVDLINALPMPVTLPCLLESLDRPLGLYASSSEAGAQPAMGPANPRIFLFRGGLIMSVVPEGPSSHLLELSEAVGERRSVKGELEFPVAETLPASEPYDRVNAGSGSTCGVCHTEERTYPEITVAFAYASDMYQDDESQGVSVGFLSQHAKDCDPAAQPERCAILAGIFGHGAVVAEDLPRDSKVCRGL